MRAPVILAVAAVAGAQLGCSGWAELEDYCERSGDCVCDDGGCCGIGGQPCGDGISCCAGYVCLRGHCGWGAVPQLRFDPAQIDFGHTDRIASAPRAFTLSNVGTVPTQPLQLDLSSMWNFAVESTCEGAALPPGQACTGTVTFTPARVDQDPLVGRFSVFEALPRLGARSVASLTATGRAGHVLKVWRHNATAAVDGQACQRWWPCVFGFDTPSVASVVSVPDPGHHLQQVAGGCAASPCDVVVEDIVEVSAVGRPNLFVALSTQDFGYRVGVYVQSPAVSEYTSSCSTYGTLECEIPAAGTTTLTLDPNTAAGWTPEWGGACAGAGTVCTLEVQGPTSVTLYLHR